MKYCNKCGSPIEDGMKFCPNCGAEVKHDKHSPQMPSELKQESTVSQPSKLQKALRIISIIFFGFALLFTLGAITSDKILFSSTAFTGIIGIMFFMLSKTPKGHRIGGNGASGKGMSKPLFVLVSFTAAFFAFVVVVIATAPDNPQSSNSRASVNTSESNLDDDSFSESTETETEAETIAKNDAETVTEAESEKVAETEPETEKEAKAKTESEKENIILKYGELGEFGKTVTLDGSDYIKYFVPAGTYTMTNKGKQGMIFLEKAEATKNSDGYMENEVVEMIKFSKSDETKEVVVESGEILNLSMGTTVSLAPVEAEPETVAKTEKETEPETEKMTETELPRESETSKHQQNVVYHSNGVINSFFKRYNQIAEYPVSADTIRDQSQTDNGAYWRMEGSGYESFIRDDEKGTYIQMKSGNLSKDVVFCYFRDISKTLDAGLTESQIDEAWNALLTGKYNDTITTYEMGGIKVNTSFFYPNSKDDFIVIEFHR